MPGNQTVGVVGLGYVGSCIAATVADRGLRVVGVDAAPDLVEELNHGYCRWPEQELQEPFFRAHQAGRLRVTTDYAALSAADVVLIAVGTPVRDDGSLDDRQLRSACLSLRDHLRPGQLVLVKSTVPPGTTRNLVLPLLESGGLTAGADFGLAFTPERLAEGNALADLSDLPMVVGGLDAASRDAASDFWRTALGVDVIPQDSLEAAEITKLADNWWIDLNIALANELAKYCALFDVDVLDVIAAANSLTKGNGNVNILMPSVGVGGSCLTKDPLMVRQSAADQGLLLETPGAGRRVNDGMPGYTARLILEDLASAGVDARSARIAVLGLAFKNNTGDLRATPARQVVADLVAAGADVRLHDPLVDANQAKDMFGIRPTVTVEEAAQDAHCLAILAYHRELADVDFVNLPVAQRCLILDGRAYFPKPKIAELGAAGYRYQGIGR
ncbi:nucleotide sugar dehydrogenase [Solwaraspora sp. WMMD406]|uniref:nucleotide sugar dehydrogenase n=1 Tax=Solwaraspora sp. WMMD406 TaxID=3016095 RepID=UPI00241762A1|nr:nucleotide sugar dehydrogenase [Solwaraspora sp. WMMD406]MDG4766923.1 nucleotide sugar dehydrogenase [Solwaraspora sp. WMMD406]